MSPSSNEIAVVCQECGGKPTAKLLEEPSGCSARVECTGCGRFVKAHDPNPQRALDRALVRWDHLNTEYE